MTIPNWCAWLALLDELRNYFQVNTDEERLARAIALRAEADKVIEQIVARKGAAR